jgi:FkbM family methyltransferase
LKAIKLLISNPFLFAKKIYEELTRLCKLHIIKDEFTLEVTRWFKDRGDETLRLDYPELNIDSIVFDLGGYVGDFAHSINEKYGCKIYLFEPHPKFYEICVNRFADNEKVIPLNYGLSDIEGDFFLSDSDKGSSFLNPNHLEKEGIRCQLKEFFNVLLHLDIKKIDLMKINIEGSEYPLLMHIAENGKLDLINEYQIQFHSFIESSKSKRDRIIQSLTKTHQQTWCYIFVWENWKRI